ncbi:MAG: hypothetical protein R3B91_02450 [Planctomycetaceae bacterium]
MADETIGYNVVRDETVPELADELFKQIHVDDWNDYHITARGNHIVLAINGHWMAEVIR